MLGIKINNKKKKNSIMAIKRLTLNDDHLKLISSFKIDELDDHHVAVCKNGIYGGSHVLEDIAMIIGKWDEAIKNTDDDCEGRAFPDELEKYMIELHSYIMDNLFYIESLLHQYVCQGGLTSGTYKCKDNELIWVKE